MFISEYFSLGSKLSDMGVFDALLDKDSHFFINVIRLKKTNISEFKEAYLRMNRYFSDIATLLDAADAPVMSDTMYRAARKNSHFTKLTASI